METIAQTVIGVLIANKLAYAYKIWRSCYRFRAVEAYSLHVRLAARSAQRLSLYRRGHRRPKPTNSPTVAWHIMVVTPKEAVAAIRMHCSYIIRHEGRMTIFAEEAGFETRRLVSDIRTLCERSEFDNSRECDLLDRKLSELSGRMKDVRTFHEIERYRITGENYLTVFISKPLLRHRRIRALPAA